MAELAGARGYVLATDIDTRWIQTNGLNQLDVQRHDIAADPPTPGEFDVIHARLVLSWLPARDAVLSRLAAALKPGGWLVVEDFDSVLHRCLDPSTTRSRSSTRSPTLSGKHFTAGASTPPGRALCRTVSPRPGLADVGAAGHLAIFHGGSPAAQLWIANIDQVGDGLIQAGLITTAERDTFRRLLDDPSFVGNYPLLITAWEKSPICPAERSHPSRASSSWHSARCRPDLLPASSTTRRRAAAPPCSHIRAHLATRYLRRLYAASVTVLRCRISRT